MTYSTIHTLIKALRPDASPGWDVITPGHLIHANTPSLCAKLADILSVVLSNNVVPKYLTQGTVLKKATSNPNVADSYRPITLGTVLSKLFELVIAPTDGAHESQYGFRQGRCTSAACTILNDVAHYHKHAGSPLFACSLDAQKCFDSIWHAGLFYKLLDHLPIQHWRILYNWYSQLMVQIKWKGSLSVFFKRNSRNETMQPYITNDF